MNLKKMLLLALACGLAAGFMNTSMARGKTLDLDAGPIYNNEDARAKCVPIAENYARRHSNLKNVRWTGHWNTVGQGKNAVCRIAYSLAGTARKVEIEAGPIYSNDDAAAKCATAGNAWQANNRQVKNFRWTGQWKTLEMNRTSVCEFEYTEEAAAVVDTPGKSAAAARADVESDKISNDRDARKKCERARQKWQSRHRDVKTSKRTGQWKPATDGNSAYCTIEYTTKTGAPLSSLEDRRVNLHAR